MWLRRLDIAIVQPILLGWRWGVGLRYAEKVMRCIPHAANDMAAVAGDGLAWVDANMNHNAYILGDHISISDIFLYVAVEFGHATGQTVDEKLTWVNDWRTRMKMHPAAEQLTLNAPPPLALGRLERINVSNVKSLNGA
jgi:glutathione S-transferase